MTMHEKATTMGATRRQILFTLLLAAAAAGCSKPQHADVGAQESIVMSANAAHNLAYTHHIRIEADERKVVAIHQASMAACRDAAADLCTVLESHIRTGQTTGASLKLRAKPDSIQKIIAALGKLGNITEQTTSAEDLAVPIAETDKKLAMLKDYQAKLEALRGNASSNVDALIKVNQELASVQGDLEALGGKRAQLSQRLDTAILYVDILSNKELPFWRPISLALSDFSGDLSHGVAGSVTGVAYLLPWVAVFGLLGWIARKLWRRCKRSNTNA